MGRGKNKSNIEIGRKNLVSEMKQNSSYCDYSFPFSNIPDAVQEIKMRCNIKRVMVFIYHFEYYQVYFKGTPLRFFDMMGLKIFFPDKCTI
jgi:hypothetical protein